MPDVQFPTDSLAGQTGISRLPERMEEENEGTTVRGDEGTKGDAIGKSLVGSIVLAEDDSTK